VTGYILLEMAASRRSPAAGWTVVAAIPSWTVKGTSDTLGNGLVANVSSATGSSGERAIGVFSAARGNPVNEKINIRHRSPNRIVCFITPSKQFCAIEVTDIVENHFNNANDITHGEVSKA
jgi:hypothetical protein